MKSYTDIEKELAAARDEFSGAFNAVENAVIVKSQSNKFALRFKYPLLIALCLLIVAAIVVFQVIWKQYDVIYFVCEGIIGVAFAAFIVLLSVTWHYTVKNSKCVERITYYKGGEKGVKCLYTEITGGGQKAEWEQARFYFKGNEAELFEGNGKIYNPFLYKKIRGHSRGYALLDSDALLQTFFNGSEVVSSENGTTVLSSGFSFTVENGVLKNFTIEGMYNECYENNFPLYAPLSVSRYYTFRYEFTRVNVPNFRLHLPDVTSQACEFYFVQPPEDDHIVVPR